MDKIKIIGTGFNVAPLLWALQANPQLWNEHAMRTEAADSPHHEVDDIFVRYAADPKSQEPHESVWYPSVDVLPVKNIALEVMALVGGEKLGGVLITRIKAGKQCKPHSDHGWHAKEYEKFAVQVQSAPGQYFCFDEQRIEPMPGDLFWFDNQYTHWVENNTEFDRITLIICIKR
jgi:hypothetical protein